MKSLLVLVQESIRSQVVHRYIPLRRFCVRASRKGMAERLIKAYLERKGWRVWRGGMLNHIRRRKQLGKDIWPNIEVAYTDLRLIIQRINGCYEDLEYLCAVHKGMPDFVAHRRGELVFIECKLGHEQLSEYQKKCLPKLQELGFNVEVWKIVEDCTKIRKAVVNLETNEKEICDKQLRLTKNLISGRSPGSL